MATSATPICARCCTQTSPPLREPRLLGPLCFVDDIVQREVHSCSMPCEFVVGRNTYRGSGAIGKPPESEQEANGSDHKLDIPITKASWVEHRSESDSRSIDGETPTPRRGVRPTLRRTTSSLLVPCLGERSVRPSRRAESQGREERRRKEPRPLVSRDPIPQPLYMLVASVAIDVNFPSDEVK